MNIERKSETVGYPKWVVVALSGPVETFMNGVARSTAPVMSTEDPSITGVKAFRETATKLAGAFKRNEVQEGDVVIVYADRKEVSKFGTELVIEKFYTERTTAQRPIVNVFSAPAIETAVKPAQSVPSNTVDPEILKSLKRKKVSGTTLINLLKGDRKALSAAHLTAKQIDYLFSLKNEINGNQSTTK